jgi:hypothetical protein
MGAAGHDKRGQGHGLPDGTRAEHPRSPEAVDQLTL